MVDLFYKKNVVFLCALTCVLVACGDENTVSEEVQESYATIDIYESSRDLPECGPANKNQQVFVKEDSSLRVCSGKVWQKVSVTEYYTNVSCYTVSLRGSRGYKVMCNGDSVGVIQNGSAGTRGENGMGCSIHYETDLERSVIVCGTDSVIVDYPLADTTKYKETPVDTSMDIPVDTIPVDTVDVPVDTIPADTVEIPVDTIPADTVEIPIDTIPADTVGIDSVEVENDSAMAVSMDSLGGYSQKGPFVKGSMVYMYELQDGRTLKQTNGNFVSRIDSDDGHFKFVARNLVSQYVLMQATGYYLNEVTNQRTTEMITLNGIVDVSKRSSANINVLTHLEYPRVNYLVTVEKKRFKDAKRQARVEILNAFHYDTTNAGDFEDMALPQYRETNALYDISVMLQGTLSVAKVTERLSKISTDLEKDGIWNDSALRAEIADWAYDSSARFVPENISQKFFYDEYGLPSYCTGDEGFFVAKNSYGKHNGEKFGCRFDYPSPASASDSLIGKMCYYMTEGDKGSYIGRYWIRDFECTENSNDGMQWHLTGSRPSELLETMTDPRDNKTYAVVTIGNQTWMAENLNYVDEVNYPSMKKRHKCQDNGYYNVVVDSSDCRLYGSLYTWAAAMDSLNTLCGASTIGAGGYDGEGCSSLTYPVQGICPDGWHLPDTSEVQELIDFVENDSPGMSATDVLRSDIGWVNYRFKTNGTDKYGFGLLQYGETFWTSNSRCAGFFESTQFSVEYGYVSPDRYFNVRCIKNKK